MALTRVHTRTTSSPKIIGFSASEICCCTFSWALAWGGALLVDACLRSVRSAAAVL